MWDVLIDKTELQADDKITMVPKGRRAVAYEGMYGSFADVSGLGLREQARMLMHPSRTG